MSKPTFTALEKLAILTEFNAGQFALKTFARQHGVSADTIQNWQHKYETEGLPGLGRLVANHHYPLVLKQAAVQAYLAGEGSQRAVAKRFGLRSSSELRSWISRYNGDKPLTASPSRKQVPKMSRNTTFEERIQVVEYVTMNNHSYAEAAEHFQVSYQQARSWVLKAKTGGYEALIDNRGHRKAATELTELDKLKLENRRLKAENKNMKLIEAFSKKLLELQRRG